MNKYWIYTIGVAVMVVVMIIGWQLFLTLSNFRSDFVYTPTTVNPIIFDRVEDRFRSADDFAEISGE